MNEFHEDPRLAAALKEFRRLPPADAPAGILVSLLERQAVARRPARGVRRWAALLVGAVAVSAGFWAGRWSRGPDLRAPEASHIEDRALTTELPEPPHIPFVSA